MPVPIAAAVMVALVGAAGAQECSDLRESEIAEIARVDLQGDVVGRQVRIVPDTCSMPNLTLILRVPTGIAPTPSILKKLQPDASLVGVDRSLGEPASRRRLGATQVELSVSGQARRLNRQLRRVRQPPFAARSRRNDPAAQMHRGETGVPEDASAGSRILQSTSTKVCVVRKSLKKARRGFDDSSSPSANTYYADSLSVR
jgi:hypothetical protein